MIRQLRHRLARPGRAAVMFLFALATFLGSPAIAQKITFQYDNPGSLLFPDTVDAVFRRSDTGAALPIRFNAPLTTEPAARLYFIPTDVVTADGIARGDFTMRFRVEDIPLTCQGSVPWEKGDVWISGGTNPDLYANIVAAKQGTGDGDFVEFTYTLTDFPYSWIGSAFYIEVVFSSLDFPCGLWSRLALEFVDPYSFNNYTPEGLEPSMTDRYYRLVRYQWKEGLEDGEAITEENKYIALVPAPMAGESVELSGLNLIVRPTSVLTDADGVFGVFAFVDPAAFDKSVAAKADTPTFGDLTLKYKQVMRTNRITGNFAEVLQAEGRIAIVGGSSGSTVKVGDILSPGTTLSLSARIGETPAQLGLRFVNGADATVAQDVFTNACITDLIVIGQTEFTDKSVIQGKTPLMSLSRYLCEQMAGFPNTPEEWALFAGKFVVKVAASSVVPVPMGYEAGAFAVKYVVGTAAGKVYDYTMTSPGDNRVIPKSVAAATKATKVLATERRVEWSTYYDGSTRIVENFDGDLGIYLSAASLPFTTTSAGVWQELNGADAVTRTWAHTPDTIDTTGPRLRMAHEYVSASLTTTFRLSATDFSGLDVSSLGVTIDGLTGDQAGAFVYKGDGVWVAEFFGYMAPQDYRVHVSLADRLGHVSTLDWLGDQIPGAPQALGAFYNGGKTWVEWNLPTNMATTDLLYYEVRQLWETLTSGWVAGPWQSVGTAEIVGLDLPAGLKTGGKYLVDVRAWYGTGVAGIAARTPELTAVATTARLDVTVTGAGAGSVTGESIDCGDDCVGFYPVGTGVTLAAAPGAGSAFVGWSGACTGTGACTVTMDAAKAVTADFAVVPNPPRLANISTRGPVYTGNDVMIGGFVISGASPKKVLITARGPSLTAYGVTGAMANPTLQLFSGQTVIAANDDWGTNANAADIAATGIAPADALESALLVTLSPGAYTAIVSGAGGGTGVGIVEVFERDRTDIPLVNISTRGQVQAGDNVMIGGFIVWGDAPKTVLVTARGPSLAPFGITNPLANPSLQIYAGQALIAANDDLGTATNLAQILATGVAPTNALESAILVTLNPGAYTAIVSGADGGTGVGIVEVFAQ